MNEIVVITGVNSGLGRSLAERFLAKGAYVWGVSKTRRDWAALKEAKHGTHLSLVQADVTSEATVRLLITQILRNAKKIDILINSAGYSNRPVRFEKLSAGEFQKNLSVNLLATFLMCKHVIPTLRKQHHGLIINISSMAGKRAVPGLAAYSASKFGVLALSQTIAKENENGNFKCITVCPGGMNTAMRAKLFGRSDAHRQQSTAFVADVIMDVIRGKVQVESGGDIVIRHGKITAINPLPAP